MGLKTKENDQASSRPKTDSATPEEPRPPKVNAEVEKRLNPYIEANAGDHDRYLKLARENPERAARSMMLKDLTYLEREATLNRKQIAGAREWLEKQPAAVQEYIGRQLESFTHAAQKDMRMLQLVLNRMRVDNSRALAATPGGAGMKVA